MRSFRTFARNSPDVSWLLPERIRLRKPLSDVSTSTYPDEFRLPTIRCVRKGRVPTGNTRGKSKEHLRSRLFKTAHLARHDPHLFTSGRDGLRVFVPSRPRARGLSDCPTQFRSQCSDLSDKRGTLETQRNVRDGLPMFSFATRRNIGPIHCRVVHFAPQRSKRVAAKALLY